MRLLCNIVATYRGPRRILRSLLEQGPREDRALALLMGSVVVIYGVQWPRLAARAAARGEDLHMLLGGALMGLVFILPLLMYLLAGFSLLVVRILGGRPTGFGMRLALFWALAATLPLLVLHGVLAALWGEEPVTGLAWCLCFGWFWIAGLVEAGWPGARANDNGVPG